MSIYLYDMVKKELAQLDKKRWLKDGTAHRMLEQFRISWSPDSRRLAYSRGVGNRNNAVFVFDTARQQTHQVTSGFYNDYNPLFSPDGNYLYLLTSRNFKPVFSDLDPVWAYINSTRIAALPLRKGIPGPADYDREKGLADRNGSDDPIMDHAAIERRMVLLPPEAGLYRNMKIAGNRLIYQRSSALDGGKAPSLFYFDINQNEEYRIAPDIEDYAASVTADRLVVRRQDEFYVAPVRENSRLKNKIAVGNMKMPIDKRREWQQTACVMPGALNGIIFMMRTCTAWTGVHCSTATRTSWRGPPAVSRLILSSVNWSRNWERDICYVRPGKDPDKPVRKTGDSGMLGINFTLDAGYYRIGEIIDTGLHSSRLRSPLSAPGVKATAGDYVLEVNGKSLSTASDPWSVFAGLAGESITLTLNDRPDFNGAWTVRLEAMSPEQEFLLRELAWMERNRKMVLGMSGGRVGYIYVPDTLAHGQNELMRQFRAQFNLPGLIIDERFNSGGALGDRFVEAPEQAALQLFKRASWRYFSIFRRLPIRVPRQC